MIPLRFRRRTTGGVLGAARAPQPQAVTVLPPREAYAPQWGAELEPSEPRPAPLMGCVACGRTTGLIQTYGIPYCQDRARCYEDVPVDSPAP